MTKEERHSIIKLLRKETGCGLMTASIALDKLIKSLKEGPVTVLDNPATLEIKWKR